MQMTETTADIRVLEDEMLIALDIETTLMGAGFGRWSCVRIAPRPSAI